MTGQTQPQREDHGREVTIDHPDLTVKANLAVPENPRGVVVFAHGTGSDRHSRRNNQVARELSRHGLATLVMDLLTGDEQRLAAGGETRQPDIPTQGARVGMACQWLAEQEETQGLPIGLFGASTGAAAALIAAANAGDRVQAVVSRGGRTDLARPVLPEVSCPTVMIVGENDTTVARLNNEAVSRLAGPATVETVPGASHLFVEPGALDRVAEHAAEFFGRHLAGR